MCKKTNCGCNTPGNAMICYTKEPVQPCIGVNLTVNNTESIDGSSGTNMILEETNNISAFKDHLEFVNSPEPLSGLKRNVVLRLTDKFLTVISNIFKGRNTGLGTSIYKGAVTEFGETFQEFKKLKDSESVEFQGGPDDIIAVVNEDWLQDQFPEIPTIDYPVIDGQTSGTGTPIYKGLTDKKINIASLYSDDFIITEFEEGIKINSPGGGSSSNDWFIDPYFVRPSNWNTPQNPKEQITYLSSMNMIDPTVYTNGQSVPVPSGKLNDPFKTYEEYLLKRIYGSGTGVPGPYSKVNPAYSGCTIQILNPVHTASDIEVVNTVYHLKNGSPLTYEGSREYAIDNAELFDNMPMEGGKIKFSSWCTIRGEGSIRRTNGFGLLRHKTDKFKTNSAKQFMLELIGEGNGIYFIEGENDSLYHIVTQEDGVTQLANGNGTCLGTTQAPVTPLISIEGNNYQYWSAGTSGTKIFINVKTQIGIHCFNEGCISSAADNFMFQVDNRKFGYQKRIYGNGIDNIMPGITSEEQDILNHYGLYNANGYVFYLPHPDFCVLKGDNTVSGLAGFRIEKVSTEANGFNSAGADSIIQLNNSQFINQTSYKDMGGGCALNFLKVTGDFNEIVITNGTILPSYFNMVKGATGTDNLGMSFINSTIHPKNIKQNLASLVIYTGGTISSIRTIPIMGQLSEYPDNASALVNLLPGMLYKDGVTKEVKQVI